MRAFGFDWQWRASGEPISVEDYRRAAGRKLPRMVWSYIEGGADDLRTVAGNRSAFDDWWLVPSVLAGHDTHDLSTRVAGLPVSMPVLTAPTDSTDSPGGAATSTRSGPPSASAPVRRQHGVDVVGRGDRGRRRREARLPAVPRFGRRRRGSHAPRVGGRIPVPVRDGRRPGRREPRGREAGGDGRPARPHPASAARRLASSAVGLRRREASADRRAQPRVRRRCDRGTRVDRDPGAPARPVAAELGRRGLDAGQLARHRAPQGVLRPRTRHARWTSDWTASSCRITGAANWTAACRRSRRCPRWPTPSPDAPRCCSTAASAAARTCSGARPRGRRGARRPPVPVRHGGRRGARRRTRAHDPARGDRARTDPPRGARHPGPRPVPRAPGDIR